MMRTIRYLARCLLPATVAMTGIFTIGAFFLTVLTRSTAGIFYLYYRMSPLLAGFCLTVLSMSILGYYANLTLSLGVTRRDYFWGSQTVLLLCSLVSTALVGLAVFLPVWCHTPEIVPPISLRSLPLLFVFTTFIQQAGGFFSYFLSRKRWLLVLGFLVIVAILMAGTLLFLLARNGFFSVYRVQERYLTFGLLAGALLFAGLSWLPLAKFTVR